MKSKVVTIKELEEDNPTFCLSPLRVFEKCPDCPVYKRHQANNSLSKMKCRPKISQKYAELAVKRRALLDKQREIEKELKNLEHEED